MLLGHLALLVLVAVLSSHLRGEDTGSNSVDSDLEAGALNFAGEHLVEVNGSALAGVVAEVALTDADETGDRSDVDDGSRPAVVLLSGLGQERKEGAGHEEWANNVGGVD